MKKYLHNFKLFIVVFALMLLASVANAADRYSVANGNWNATTTWSASSGGASGASIPVAGDNVIIEGTRIVTVISTVACTNLTVGTATTGTLRIGDGTARTITVSGSVTVASTGTITIPNFNDTHTFNIGGNLSNAGVFDMNTGADDLCNVVFNGAANQTVSGAGATTDFNLITINNNGAANNNIVEILSSAFTVPPGFLTLTDGILKVSGSFALTNTFFNIAGYTIPAAGGVWLNNANATVTGQGGDATLAGSLRVSAGTYNVGNSNDDDLRYDIGSSLTIDGGALNVAAAFTGTSTPTAETITFNMSSGTMLLSTFDNGSGTRENFDMGVAGSSFTMSGGTIIIQRVGSDAAVNEWDMRAGTTNITGGTLQFGNASTPAAQTFEITSASITPNVVISTTNSPILSLNGTTTFRGNVSINTGATLNANSQAISVSGNWTNNGNFISGTQTTTFNGTAAQSIGGVNTTNFNAITFNNTFAGIAIIIARGATISGVTTFTDGIVSTDATNFLTLGNAATIPGAASDGSHVDGPVRKLGNFPGTFRFPCGDAGQYEFLEIARTVAGATAYDFTAFYNRTSATTLDPDVVAPVKNVSGCDHWILNHSGTFGAPAVSVTLSWSDLNPCGTGAFVTLPSALTIARLNAGSWSQTAGGVTSSTGTSASGTVTRTLVSAFSPFSLANTAEFQNPLPVTFSDVKAFEKGTGVQIEWTNLTEKDVLTYTVERSANGRDFASISQLTSRSNQSDKQSYLSFDGSPLSGTNYYRIKVLEVDGKIILSKILKVDIGRTVKGISLYPNPVPGSDVSITFAAAKGQYVLHVINNAGQEVYSKQLVHPGGSVSQSVELPASLKTGVYNLMISGDNYRETKMFIMQ